LRPILPRQLQAPQPGQKVHKLAAVLEQRTIDDVYLKLVSQWQDPHALVPGAAEPPSALTDGAALKSFAQPLARMMYLDLVSYLPDDILVKVDRASMAVSLETRIPLLDHRLIEFAWRVPMRTKVAGGTAKRLLRSVLYRYVPQALLDRPKMGFGVPIDSWLRGPLRPWADHLLDPVRLKAQGFLAPEPITRAWREHRDQVRDWHYPLWAVLMFQAWHEQTHERKSVA
jgi:asparagine synthase (glutamine-hydrolysing)